MNPKTVTKTLIKELEAASHSYYEAEQYADSIPTEKILSAPDYLKENIRKHTMLNRKSKSVSLFNRNRYPLLHYSLQVCFTMCCSLIFLFSDYTLESQYYLKDNQTRLEQTKQSTPIPSLLQITYSKEDTYHD